MSKQKRLVGIDIFRGIAILFMGVYHFFYDLTYFKYIEIDFTNDLFLVWFRYVIVAMFLLTVGMSLKLANYDKINWDGIKKRFFILGGAAFLVSISTYIQFSQTWVYFGILHFILVASFLALPFLNTPRVALTVAVVIMAGYLLKILHMKWLFAFLVEPLHLPLEYTEDVVRFFPWFSFVLLGIVIVNYRGHNILFDNHFFNRKKGINKILSFMGRHALVIYLLHLPLLFGLFILVD